MLQNVNCVRSIIVSLVLGALLCLFPVAVSTSAGTFTLATADAKPPPGAIAKSAGAKSSKSAAASKSGASAKAKSGAAAKQNAAKSKAAIASKSTGAKAAATKGLRSGNHASALKVPPKAAKSLNNAAKSAKSVLPKGTAAGQRHAPKATGALSRGVPKASGAAKIKVPPKAAAGLNKGASAAKSKGVKPPKAAAGNKGQLKSSLPGNNRAAGMKVPPSAVKQLSRAAKNSGINRPTGNAIKFDKKGLQSALKKRGWSKNEIRALTTKSKPIGRSIDRTTGRRDSASVYGTRKNYVVVNNRTGQVVQISNKNKKNWKPDRNIEFYKK